MKLKPASSLPTLASWPNKNNPGILWLGQAGFWIDTGAHKILIDPYLSNSLAKKYAGKKFPHIRMMPAPIAPENLSRPDLILITHAHTDHMDSETLQPIFKNYPDVPFIVPKAKLDVAQDRISPTANLIAIDADEVI